MKAIRVVKVIEVPTHDRYIFVTYDDNDDVIGLNFHQGIGHIDPSFFSEICVPLTAIYKYLVGNRDSSAEFFNECVERYCHAMIYFDIEELRVV